VNSQPQVALTNLLGEYQSALEVGIGRRPSVARNLSFRDVSVHAIDIVQRSVPAHVRFHVDDIVAASRQSSFPHWYHVEVIYALNLPAELQRPVCEVAQKVGADVRFTTLGFESPAIATRPKSLDGGETVYIPIANEQY
jgi:uncharacterized UPF0146 family protein